MSKLNLSMTNFTAGIINPELYGRSDLKAYQNGARCLDNLYLHATGGISKRSGLRHLKAYEDKTDMEKGRLIPFMFNADQIYLIAFGNGFIDIFLQDTLLTRVENSPFLAEHNADIRTTISADMMLIVHKDLPPMKLVRLGEANWGLQAWEFYEADSRLHQPYFKFASDTLTLAASATSGTITLNASADFFHPDHVGLHFRIQNKEVILKTVSNSRSATATTRETLTSTSATEDWQEPAFSNLRGWPQSLCFHQDRLIIGGSRDLPNRVWGSKSIDFFNFDLGEGLDDEGLEVALLADQVNRIEAIFSGRDLQIFTSGAEWIIEGEPLTPASMILSRQTRTGSKSSPHVTPCYIEGGTIFAARGSYANSSTALCEFVYTEDDQTFMATDLTVMAKHLIKDPIDQDYDRINRRLYVVMSDGSLAVLTIFRAENVFGWTRILTQGNFLSIAALHDFVYVLVERQGQISLERFDDSLYLDQAMVIENSPETRIIEGLSQFEAQTVQITADGIYQGEYIVTQGLIELHHKLQGRIIIGLSYDAKLEPLPLTIDGSAAYPQLESVRLLRSVFRLIDSAGIELDLGQGFEPIILNPQNLSQTNNNGLSSLNLFSGDIERRALGWKKSGFAPLWAIKSSLPLPLTILSATAEIYISA